MSIVAYSLAAYVVVGEFVMFVVDRMLPRIERWALAPKWWQVVFVNASAVLVWPLLKLGRWSPLFVVLRFVDWVGSLVGRACWAVWQPIDRWGRRVGQRVRARFLVVVLALDDVVEQWQCRRRGAAVLAELERVQLAAQQEFLRRLSMRPIETTQPLQPVSRWDSPWRT